MIFGSARGHQDPTLADANRRFRLHLARDINDEQTLARDGELPIRRGRHWVWFAVAFLVLGLVAAVGGRHGSDVPIAASCTTPGIALSSATVPAGAGLQYRLTGPDGIRYVVTLDGQPVRGDAGSTVSYTDTAAGPALELQQCLSPALLVAAPAGNGPHQLAVLELDGSGRASQVASATVTVTGTR